MPKKTKKEYNLIRQNFLLSFFDDEDKYAEKEVHGFWLVKHWNKDTHRWQIAIYTQESFKRYKGHNNPASLFLFRNTYTPLF